MWHGGVVVTRAGHSNLTYFGNAETEPAIGMDLVAK